MFEALLLFGIVLWLTLAVATGVHARGHGRSGILWFLAVAVTGIFGLAFYLLAITSSTSPDTEGGGSDVDQTLVTTVPKYVGSIAVGGLSAGVVAYVWLEFSISVTRSPETFDSPISSIAPVVFVLFVIAGLAGGAYITYTFGMRKLTYLLAFAPVASLGILGGLDLLRLVAGPLANFHESLVFAGVPLFVGGLGAVSLALLWRYLYRETVPNLLQAVRDGNPEAAVTAVTTTRREVLAATAGSCLFFGGRIAQAESRPQVTVEDTAIRFTGDQVFVDVTVANPRSETVVVYIDGDIDVYETITVRDIPTVFHAEATATLEPGERKEVTLSPIDGDTVRSKSDVEIDQITLTLKNSIWSRL